VQKPIYRTLFAATLIATVIVGLGATTPAQRQEQRQREWERAHPQPTEEKENYDELDVTRMDVKGDGVSAKITLVRDPFSGCIYWYPTMQPRLDADGTPHCRTRKSDW
jgi:hypothetical protein